MLFLFCRPHHRPTQKGVAGTVDLGRSTTRGRSPDRCCRLPLSLQRRTGAFAVLARDRVGPIGIVRADWRIDDEPSPMDCIKTPPRRSSPILLRTFTLVFLREFVDHAYGRLIAINQLFVLLSLACPRVQHSDNFIDPPERFVFQCK